MRLKTFRIWKSNVCKTKCVWRRGWGWGLLGGLLSGQWHSGRAISHSFSPAVALKMSQLQSRENIKTWSWTQIHKLPQQIHILCKFLYLLYVFVCPACVPPLCPCLLVIWWADSWAQYWEWLLLPPSAQPLPRILHGSTFHFKFTSICRTFVCLIFPPPHVHTGWPKKNVT